MPQSGFPAALGERSVVQPGGGWGSRGNPRPKSACSERGGPAASPLPTLRRRLRPLAQGGGTEVSPLLPPSPPPSRLRGVPGQPRRGGGGVHPRRPRSGRAPPGRGGGPGPQAVRGGGISRCTPPGPGVPLGHVLHLPPEPGGRSGPFSQALNWGLCSLSALWGGRAGVLSLPPRCRAGPACTPRSASWGGGTLRTEFCGGDGRGGLWSSSPTQMLASRFALLLPSTAQTWGER